MSKTYAIMQNIGDEGHAGLSFTFFEVHKEH